MCVCVCVCVRVCVCVCVCVLCVCGASICPYLLNSTHDFVEQQKLIATHAVKRLILHHQAPEQG